jgi:hypothetical protein
VTTDEALEFIKANIGGDDSAKRNEMALAALNATVSFMNLLGEYRWNEQMVNITLTANKSLYDLDDFFPNFTVRKIFDELIFYTAETGWIEIVSRKEFNQYKQGHVSTGKPTIATIHSRTPVIEFYPTPSKAYALRLMVGVLITSFDDLPGEMQLPVVHLAIMSAVGAGTKEAPNATYVQSAAIWSAARAEIEKTGFWTVFKDDQIEPDKYIGGTGEGGTYVDSTNIVGN